MYKKKRLYISLAVLMMISAAVLTALILRGFFPRSDDLPKRAEQPYNTERIQIYPPPPETENIKKIREEFTDLRKYYDNTDIIGYISIPGTSIDYPVVQSKDNDYYLTHDIFKTESASGWIFLDYENRIYTLDKNTIIYGHNMKNDEMFHALRNYADEEFFNNNRFIEFRTLYEDTLWEVFAFGRIPIALNYLEVNPVRSRFSRLLTDIVNLSLYDTGVSVSADDKILNLSTCTGGRDEVEYRYVLSAKLVSN